MAHLLRQSPPPAQEMEAPTGICIAASQAQCQSIVVQKSAEQIAQAVQGATSPDIHFEWPDVGIDIRGRQGLIGYWGTLKQSIPDYTARIDNIVEEQPLRVRVTFVVSGTQTTPFLPMFPIMKHIRWRTKSVMTFDFNYKLKEQVNTFEFAELVRLEGPCWEGLAQAALALASTPGGSRLLQRAIEVARPADYGALLQQLRGNVWEAAGSPHANYVLQKFIVTMPSGRASFVIDELAGRAVQAARHTTRSRVLQRVIEYCPASQTEGLVAELLRQPLPLCRHPFGNFVLQSVLEHGTAAQRRRLAEVILDDVHRLARHRMGSNVLRRALVHCAPEDSARIAEALTADPNEVAHLMHHLVGSHVWRELRLMSRSGGHGPPA